MPPSPGQPPASAPTSARATTAVRPRVRGGLPRFLSRIGLRRDRRLLLFAAITGVAMAGAALAFIRPIQWAEHAAIGWLSGHPARAAVAIAVVPVLGALLCGVVLAALPVRIRAHGISSVLYAIHRRRAQLPASLAARTWLGATAIISSGGSAGPEGPIVTIGATLGSMFSRLLRVDAQSATALVGCGAAAGIAAVFNAPLTGIFFVLEVLLRDFSLRAFMPIVIASVFAAATVQSLIGSQEPLFGVEARMFEGAGEGLSILQTPAFVLTGLACGIVSVFFVRLLQGTEHAFARLPIPRWTSPAAGAAVLSVLGILHLALAGDVLGFGQGDLPPFYGNGYPLAERVLDPAFYAHNTALVTGSLLLSLAIVKCVATSLTLGSGGVGGIFAPSLVIGALVGGAIGSLGAALPLLGGVGPVPLALAGMAGVVAGTTHAPLAGAMLVYELTRQPSILMPVMLVAALSTIVARLLERHSFYTAELAALGVRLGHAGDMSALRRMRVRDVPLGTPHLIRGSAPAASLVDLAVKSREFVVLDDADRLEGMIGPRDLRVALVHREAMPLLEVRDVARTGTRTLDLDMPLDHALDLLRRGPLPVEDRSGMVVGVLTRGRLLRAWRRHIEADR